MKKGTKSFSQWKKRYFELEGNRMELTYYKKQPTKTPRGRSNSVHGKEGQLGFLVIDPYTTSIEIVQEYIIRGKSHKVTEVVVEPSTMDNSILNMKTVFKTYKRRQSSFVEQRKNSTPKITKTTGKTDVVSKNLANTFKFKVKCAVSFTGPNRDKKYEHRSYKFNAESEEERQRWITAIEIVMSRKRQALERERQSHLFMGSREYENFLKYLLVKAKPIHVIQCFNAIRAPVEEQEVTALMVLYDHGSDIQSDLNSIPLCQAAILDEIANSSDHGTLFRRNSISTKLVTLFFKIHGLKYLQDLLQTKLIKICLENDLIDVHRDKLKEGILKQWKAEHTGNGPFEVDEYRLEEETSLLLDESVKKITDICKDILDAMMASTDECPLELREIMRFMMEECEKNFSGYGETCVGGLYFLRFVCPAIISPHLFGIVNSCPQPNAMRTLVLITKVLQNIANGGGDTEKKEAFMKCLTPFTASMVAPAKRFLRELATVDEQEFLAHQQNEKKNLEFIDEDLKTRCLHILHQWFREAHLKKKYQKENNVDEEVDYVYKNIISELNLEKFSAEQLSKPSPQNQPKKKRHQRVQSQDIAIQVSPQDVNTTKLEEPPSPMKEQQTSGEDSPQNSVNVSGNSIVISAPDESVKFVEDKEKSAPNTDEPAEDLLKIPRITGRNRTMGRPIAPQRPVSGIVRRNGTTQVPKFDNVPLLPITPVRMADLKTLDATTRTKKLMDILASCVQSIVEQFESGGGDERNNRTLGQLIRYQLCITLYAIMKAGLKDENIWDYVSEIAEVNEIVGTLYKNIDTADPDVVKFTILICNALNEGAIHATVMVLMDNYEFQSQFYYQEDESFTKIFAQRDKILELLCRLLDRRFMLLTSPLDNDTSFLNY
jgi:hypothetical protein